MKNRRVVLFLLTIGVLVWGLVIYRIYRTVKQPIAKPDYQFSAKVTEEVVTNEKWNIVANYRDPFLGKFIDHTSPKAIKTPITITKVDPKPISWPNIKYNGLIKNNYSNTKAIILSINGKIKTLKLNVPTGDLTVNRILPDSVELIFHGEKRVFKKGSF